jgi:hypothetical protein
MSKLACRGLSELKKDDYCLRIYDGGVGPCGPTEVELTIVFKNERDALGYLALDFFSTRFEEEEIEDDQKKMIQELKHKYESLIKKQEINATEVDSFIDKFNKIFASKYLEIQVMAHGAMNEYISSKYIINLMKEYIDDGTDTDEVDDLYKIVSSGKFDAENTKHFEMAESFLEQTEKY